MHSLKTLVIHTQYKENYGDEQNPYWKFKGGSTYFVTDLTDQQVAKIEATGIPTLTNLIEYKNSGSEEYVLEHQIRDLGKNGDGQGPICETWETPIQFRWDGSKWVAQTNHTYGEDDYVAAPIVSKATQWIPLQGGDREKGSYACQYKTPNGWFDADSLQLKQEVAEAQAQMEIV
tara:strand:+ start:7848 stop:8372 length:525 start_codon:yes stop_codon:yes gene_type:complete